MLKIYHNPRCKKSREGLQLIEESRKDFQIVKYLDTPLTTEEITELLKYLNISAEELIRKKESVWKENYKGKDFSEKELIQLMQTHPKLIERPIVVKGEKAVIGRPPERIKELL